MAALAYLLLPLTGMVAYFAGRDERVRFHGLQAVVLGLVLPVCLYAASALSPSVTRVVFGAGLLLWGFFLVATGIGRDPGIPGLSGVLRRWSR